MTAMTRRGLRTATDARTIRRKFIEMFSSMEAFKMRLDWLDGCEVATKERLLEQWLGTEDSNLALRIQSPLSYH